MCYNFYSLKSRDQRVVLKALILKRTVNRCDAVNNLLGIRFVSCIFKDIPGKFR